MSERKSPFAVAKRVMELKFPSALLAFVAGSFNRNEATEYSDIDLVVIFPKLDFPWREAFVFDGWPVEAFVHDPETLHCFFRDAHHKHGTPALLRMVVEGPLIPEGNELGIRLKALAQKILDEAPPKWDKETIDSQRYAINELVDDIRAPRDHLETCAVVGALHETLGNFYFKANGLWTASRKHIPRKLSKADPQLYAEWAAAFSDAFQGRTEKVIKLAEKITKPFGGLLFDGYRSDGPKDWKLALPDC